MTGIFSRWIPALSALLLAACRSLPADGGAVECGTCRAMWIYLTSHDPAPGFYRLEEEVAAPRTCPQCEKLAVRYFESGKLPARCPDCAGRLERRGVEIID